MICEKIDFLNETENFRFSFYKLEACQIINLRCAELFHIFDFRTGRKAFEINGCSSNNNEWEKYSQLYLVTIFCDPKSWAHCSAFAKTLLNSELRNGFPREWSNPCGS